MDATAGHCEQIMDRHPPYIPPVKLSFAPPPNYRLYSPAMILVAAFLGFPIAGFLLIGANYRALGRKGASWGAWTGGVLLTVGIMVAAYLLRQHVSIYFFSGIGVLGTYWIAVRLQGSAYAEHVSSGGRTSPAWKVAVVVGVVLTFFFCFQGFAHWLARVTDMPPLVKVTVGGRITVNGGEGTTEAEARAVGEALLTVPWYADRQRDCGLERKDPGHALSFILKPGTWDKPENIARFQEIARTLNRRLPNLGPWEVRLRDQDFTLHRTIEP
jgi:hypothetical protein